MSATHLSGGRPHASIPRSPLLAEPMFLARYVEKAGPGHSEETRPQAERAFPRFLPGTRTRGRPDREDRSGQSGQVSGECSAWRPGLRPNVLRMPARRQRSQGKPDRRPGVRRRASTRRGGGEPTSAP